MSDNVVEFPGNPPPEGYSEEYIAKLHSAAFRDLETWISGCLYMAEIAARLMPDETDGTVMFAVYQTKDMLLRLKERYHALWHGEVRPS